MAAIFCPKCHKTLKDINFYTYRDGRKVEICKSCLTLHVNNFEPDTFLWILEKMDVPYVPSEWNVLRDRDYAKDPNKVGGAAVLGKYLAKMKLKQFNKYRWADSEALQAEEEAKLNEHLESLAKQDEELKQQFENGEISEAEYKTLVSSVEQEKQRSESRGMTEPIVEDTNFFDENKYMSEEDIPDPAAELTEDDKVKLCLKWGRLYEPREWIQLEQMYTEMMESFDIQDADTINTLVLICKVNLKANQALDTGDYEGFKKLSSTLEQMRKSAKFTAAQKKEEKVDAVDCVGELVSMCEKEGFIPRFATDIPQDKVDITLRDMKEYVQKLVTQDLGFGQQIEDALKKIEIQKEMREKEGEELFVSNEDTINDEDYQEYFAEIEKQKEKDLDVVFDEDGDDA